MPDPQALIRGRNLLLGRQNRPEERDQPDAEPPEPTGLVAIYVWGVSHGAFSNLASALAAGLLDARRGPVQIVHLRSAANAAAPRVPGVGYRPFSARRSITSILELRRYLRAERPQVLITMPTIVTIPALVGYLLSGKEIRRHTRFVIHQGDTLKSDVTIDHARSVRLRLLPALARRLYRYAAGLTTCAPGVLDLMERDGVRLPGSRQIIGNPVDVDRYRADGAAMPAHPWLVEKTGPVITTLGRLSKRKNHAMLLAVLARVRAAGIDARLVIIGDGPERASTLATAAALGVDGQVSLTGMLANPHAEIAASDVFVMSSVDEAFCLALVEAMACGVPVISTDAIGGGPRWILDPTRAAPGVAPGEPARPGIEALRSSLVARDDVDAMATQMIQILTDEGHRTRLSAAGRLRADDFHPHAVGRTLAAFLDRL